MTSNPLFLSTMAGLCTLIGAVIVLARKRIKRQEFGFYLGLASGVMLAVVAFDLAPGAIVQGEPFGFCFGLFWGWVLLALIQPLLLDQERKQSRTVRIGYLIMLGIALHDIPEGIAVALGFEVSHRIAAVVAMGIAIHNVPEGMALAAPLLRAGKSRKKIAINAVLVGLVTPAGTVAGNVIMKMVPGCFGILMGLAAGVMLYLVVKQLWPEARKSGIIYGSVGAITGVVIILLTTFI
ncbi:MAG: ZIP family metal transporter [Chitinophagales bacterium]